MNIDQSTNIISQRKNGFLDIGYYDQGGTKIFVEKKLEATDNWRDVLKQIFSQNNVSEAFIDLYSPNGSSYKLRESIRIENNNSMYSSNQSQSLMGLPTSAGSSNDQFFNYVIRDKEEKIIEKNEMIKELKDQLKLDQDTIRELRVKNMDLEKDNKFKEKGFELARYEDTLNEKEKAKTGLSGITDVVSELAGNPNLMKIAEMYMASRMGQGQMGQLEENVHPSIPEIVLWLKSQPEATILKVHGLIGHFSSNSGSLDMVGKFLQQE